MDSAIESCEPEEGAVRSVLRRQYNQQSVDRLMPALRQTVRDSLIPYLRR